MQAVVGQKKQICKRCHKRLDATTDYFRIHSTIEGVIYLRKVCLMCEAASRHRDDPWIVKAWSTIKKHREAYAKEYEKAPERFPSWDGNPLTFAEAYGWVARLIADEMKATFQGPCKGCGVHYTTMGHGAADLTVDIIDHTKEPFYDCNTRLLCGSCNSRKGRRAPDIASRLRQAYARWNATPEDHSQPSFLPATEPQAKPTETKPVEQKPATKETGQQLKLFQAEDIWKS